MKPAICLSCDVEEFDVPEEYGYSLPFEDQVRISAEGTRVLLNLLKETDAVATFFVTGRFAEAQPDLVREIADTHEIASHGWSHTGFRLEDLRTSRDFLADLTGKDVVGFRRARLADTPTRALLEAGYRYDSSENPIWLPGRYCHLTKPRRPYDAGGILRIPVSASPWIRFPLFWLSFRNFPVWLYRRMCAWTLRADGAVFLYCHPWEFCDISTFGLPSYISRGCGNPMVDRFRSFLTWLAGKGEFSTYASQVDLLADKPN